jgi:hypothetical protein
MFDFSPSPIDTKEENLVKPKTGLSAKAAKEMDSWVVKSPKLEKELDISPIKEKENASQETS